jgi:hypothetical protein
MQSQPKNAAEHDGKAEGKQQHWIHGNDVR